MVLAFDLHYQSGFLIDVYLNIGSRNTDSSNSSSSNLFGTNNTNICMAMLVI